MTLSRPSRISQQRRAQMKRLAREIRARGQRERCSRDVIVEAILREVPDMLPLEAFRHAHGWSRPDVSLGLDELYRADGLMPPQVRSSEICRWEHGRHLPNAERQDYLARLYRTRPDLLGFGRDHSVQPEAQPAARVVAVRRMSPTELVVELEDEDMERRTVIKLLGGIAVAGAVAPTVDVERLAAAAARPRPVDLGLVEGLRAVVTELADLPQSAAPGPVLAPAMAFLGHVERLLGEAAPEEVRRELAYVAGEAAIVVGRLHRNLGNVDLARPRYVYAKQLADELGIPLLGAYARLVESELHSQLAIAASPKDTEVALRLIGEALAQPSLPAPMRTKLAAVQAEELATLGRGAESAAALERAHRSMAEVRDVDRVGFFSAWTEERLGGFEGTCRLLLDEPRTAALRLERSLRAIEPRNVGIVLALRIDLGAAYVRQGDADEGARVLGEAYREAMAMGHTHLVRRALRARERLGRGEPGTRELTVLSA